MLKDQDINNLSFLGALYYKFKVLTIDPKLINNINPVSLVVSTYVH